MHDIEELVEDPVDSDNDSDGHIPMFPSRYYKIERTLAILYSRGAIATENQDMLLFNSYNEFKQLLFDKNLQLYTSTVIDPLVFPYADELLHDDKADVSCTRTGTFIGVLLRQGHASRNIGKIDKWDLPLTVQSLEIMREFFDYMDCGVALNPAGIGYKAMLRIYNENKMRRSSVLNGRAEEYLLQHVNGGRAYTMYQKGAKFPEVYEVMEVDQKIGYGAAWKQQSIGTTISTGKYVDSCDNWFAECEVTAKVDLPIGPCVYKTETDTRYSWTNYGPTVAGETITSYMWKVEAESAEQHECIVRPKNGFGWKESTEATAPWVEFMYEKRRDAPAHLKPFVKLSTVGGMGRHASGYTFYRLVVEGKQDANNVPYSETLASGKEFDSLYYVQPYENWRKSSMTHWFYNATAKVAVKTFDLAFKYAMRGDLIMTDYDSVIFIPDYNDYQIYTPKEKSEHLQPGEWTSQLLTDFEVLGNRSFYSNEKTNTPGVPHATDTSQA